MMRKIARVCLLSLLAVLLVSGFGAAQAQANFNININIDFKFSQLFANFPVPIHAEQVDKRDQRHGREWTEYRVNMPPAQCTAFYERQMPHQGWRFTSRRDGRSYWTRGRRTMVVMFVPVSRRTTLIVVQEQGYRGNGWHKGWK